MPGRGRSGAPGRGQVVKPSREDAFLDEQHAPGRDAFSVERRVARGVVRDADQRPRDLLADDPARRPAVEKEGSERGEQGGADGGIEQPLPARKGGRPIGEGQGRRVGQPPGQCLDVGPRVPPERHADLARPARPPRHAQRDAVEDAVLLRDVEAGGVDDPLLGAAAAQRQAREDGFAARGCRHRPQQFLEERGRRLDLPSLPRGRRSSTGHAGGSSAATGRRAASGTASASACGSEAAAKRGAPSSHQRAAQPSSRRHDARSSAGDASISRVSAAFR